MGKIEKGVKCSVVSCGKEAVRSMSVRHVELTGLKVEGSKRAYLCGEHYKEFKKRSEGTRQVERWRWSA